MLTMCEWISLWLWHILNQDLINKLGKYKKSFNFHSAIHENLDNWYLRRSCLNKFWKLPVIDWEFKCANGAILVKLVSVSSEQKVPLVMFANIVCSSVSRNAGLGGGVAGVGGKRSLLGNSLAGVLVELRTARRHTSHTHWPTGHPKETSSCFPTFIVCTLGMGMYGYTELLDIQD